MVQDPRFSSSIFSEIGQLLADNIFKIIIAVCIAYFVVFKFIFFTPYQAPKTVTASLHESGDPCFQKERCLIVFVAPWCGVCQEELPFLGEIYKFVGGNKNIGFKVMVGMDEPQKLNSFAQQIHAPTVLDQDKSFQRGMEVSRVPAFFWLDKNGRVLDHPRRAYQLIPGKSQVESYFTAMFPSDRKLIFGG